MDGWMDGGAWLGDVQMNVWMKYHPTHPPTTHMCKLRLTFYLRYLFMDSGELVIIIH
jgi:hypothetical protein